MKSKKFLFRDGRFKPIFTSWYGCWIVTLLSVLAEDFTLIALELSRFNAVEANIELKIIRNTTFAPSHSTKSTHFLAVRRMSIMRMSDNLTCSVIFVLVFRTNKSIFQFLLRLLTVLTVRIIRPDASSRVLIEVQTTLALCFNVFTINARVENIANRLIGMGEDSVLSRTVVVRAAWWFWMNKFMIIKFCGNQRIQMSNNLRNSVLSPQLTLNG